MLRASDPPSPDVSARIAPPEAQLDDAKGPPPAQAFPSEQVSDIITSQPLLRVNRNRGWTPAGSPDDEVCGQYHVLVLQWLIEDELLEHGRGLEPHLCRGHADRRQRRIEEIGKLDVVTADQSDLVGDGDAKFLGGQHHTHGESVAHSNQGSWRLITWGVSDEPITTWIFNKSCPEMKEAFWLLTGQAPTSDNAGSC